ncbi:hypothetical protein KKC45_00085 [Patescibacteria group bacterium]|nr:hypothetical protein [Patescibacteria group bacterium]
MWTGKFVVLYGINNLGKTCQAKRLVRVLKDTGYKAEYLKYPIYDLEPTGPMINDYLRNGNPDNLGLREVQMLYAQNRQHFQLALIKKLKAGVWVIAEDYIGTSLGWGGKENLDFLERLNSALVREDISILFDGERFVSGIETGHKHENNDRRTSEVRDLFLNLAKKKCWRVVQANQTEDEVFEQIKKVFRKEGFSI